MHFFPRIFVITGLAFGFALPAFGKAPTSAQHAEWCKRLTARLPGVSTATCQNSALVTTGATSLQGFPILKRQIAATKNSKDSKAIRIMLLGGIHGDELTASAIVFQWMQWMKNSPAQDFYWNVVPVVNPDGLMAAKPTRVNANGVDLNRNFPTPDWQKEAPRYWAKVTGSDPRRFPGKAPLSEPESRWVNQEMERFKPDVIISVHAPFGVLDFDGPVAPPHQFGRLIFNRVGVYPGSLGNYSGMHKNVPVITIELPNAGTMPPDVEVQRIWTDMLTWIQKNVPKKGEAPPNPPAPIIAQKAAEKIVSKKDELTSNVATTSSAQQVIEKAEHKKIEVPASPTPIPAQQAPEKNEPKKVDVSSSVVAPIAVQQTPEKAETKKVEASASASASVSAQQMPEKTEAKTEAKKGDQPRSQSGSATVQKTTEKSEPKTVEAARAQSAPTTVKKQTKKSEPKKNDASRSNTPQKVTQKTTKKTESKKVDSPQAKPASPAVKKSTEKTAPVLPKS